MEESKGKVMNATKEKLEKARGRRSTLIRGPNLNLHVNPSSMFEIRVLSNDDLKTKKTDKKDLTVKSSRIGLSLKDKASSVKLTDKKSVGILMPNKKADDSNFVPANLQQMKINQSALFNATGRAPPTDSKVRRGILKGRQPVPPDNTPISTHRHPSIKTSAHESLQSGGQTLPTIGSNQDTVGNVDDETPAAQEPPTKLPILKESRHQKFRKIFCPAILDPPEVTDVPDLRQKKGSLRPSISDPTEEEGENEAIGEQEEEAGEDGAEEEEEETETIPDFGFLPEHMNNSEEFTEYLRKSGAWEVLGRCFISLYQDHDHPKDPIGVFLEIMIHHVSTVTQIETALLDIANLKQYLLDLTYHNEELLQQKMQRSRQEEEIGETEEETLEEED